MRFRSWAWRRSLATGVLSVALVGAAGVSAGPSAAGVSAPAPAAEVGLGTAKATAKVVEIAPGVGGLELAVKNGVAIAQQTNSIAQAQSESADLGLIGTSLTAESCGGDGALRPEDLPQPLRVDNRGGKTSESRDEAPLGPIGGYRLAAEATEVPSATSSSEAAGGGIPGLLDIGGGTALAETEAFPGKGREARAVVDLSLDLAGVLELDGIEWRARHRTGTERAVDGSFSIGSGTLGGIPLPLEDLGAVQEAINEGLAYTGLSIRLPRVQRLTEPADLVRVTPLVIRIDDSEAGATLLGPVLNQSREAREEFFNQVGAAICEAKSLLLLADVGVAIAAGTGFMTIAIGGVEASSAEFAVGDAIGLPPPIAPVAPVATSGGPVGTTGSPLTPGPARPGSSPTATPTESAGTTAAAPVSNLGPLETVCESVHPFEWPSCSEGAATTAGLLGLLATGTMVGLDVRRQRGVHAVGDVPGEVPTE